MTISTTSNKAQWQGNGSTTVFSFSFYVGSSSQAQVYYKDASGNITLLSPTSYSISGLGSPTGGTITYPLSGSPIASGTSLTLLRSVPLQQLADIANQDNFYPDTVEGALDYQMMAIQQLNEEVGRQVSAPPEDPNPQMQLPSAAVRANMALAFDQNGNPMLIAPGNPGSYQYPASGSVARTVAAKLQESVSVLDFGADPTGVADSTAAFASASANTTNAVVPVGTYLFSSNVPLACSLELLSGAKLKPASGVTITLTAPFIAQDFQQIFDLSLGGNISIASSQPYLTPQHFGAVPGSDCTTAMQKSLAAAKSAACGWHFPNAQGLYKYNSSSPLQITTAISITNDGSATIDGTGSTGDCFQFQAGTYAGNKYDFPDVQNFTSGIAIRNLDGANEVFGKIGKISGCAGGISLETATTAGGGTDTCVDNTYWFEQIDSCGFGTQLLAVDASSALQGNCFYGNFISRCTNSIYFNGPASVTPGWQGNYWEVQAIDGFSGTNSRGIYAPKGGINGQTVKCPTYFGGFSLEYINVGPNSNQNTFEVYFNTLADYTKLSINGIGNFVRPYGANATIRSVPLTAETASNSRSSFNGGNPVVDSTQTLSLAIPSLSAGATTDFYSYSPYTDGYSSKFWLQMIDSQGIIPITVEDASVVAGTDGNTVANQVHIRLMAVTAVTAHTALAILHTRTS